MANKKFGPVVKSTASAKKSVKESGPKDFTTEDYRMRTGDWYKKDGHQSLNQENPIGGNPEMSIETSEDHAPKWEE